jgi:hypothetical protein
MQQLLRETLNLHLRYQRKVAECLRYQLEYQEVHREIEENVERKKAYGLHQAIADGHSEAVEVDDSSGDFRTMNLLLHHHFLV